MKTLENLLVISNWFPSKDNKYVGAIFVKEQLKALTNTNTVSKIQVVAPQPYFYKQSLLKSYKDGIIEVYFPRFLYIPWLFSYSKLGDYQYFAILKLVKRFNVRPDIIHSHFLWFSGYSGAKLKSDLETPLVLTAHGYDVYDVPFRTNALKKKVKFALDAADHIITVSNLNKRILVEKLGVLQEKISVIPNGYDPKKFYPIDKYKAREILGVPFDKYILISIGNLLPVKGHEYLIRALHLIQKRAPEMYDKIELYIIGDGRLKRYLRSLIRTLGLDSVHLLGAKPHEEIPLWINASDVVVIPSLNEGVPTVLFEALGCGKPVIATEVGGIPEIITQDVGVLVPPGDPNSLADAILISENSNWNINAILKLSTQFSWENIVGRVLGIYSQLLK